MINVSVGWNWIRNQSLMNVVPQYSVILGEPFFVRPYRYLSDIDSTLKLKCRHIEEFFLSFYTGICQFDNFIRMRLSSESWWRHQMEAFSALLAICAGNSPVSGEFPTQRPVTRSFDIFFNLRLNKRLSKQSWGWWFETLSVPLWRQCDDDSISVSV